MPVVYRSQETIDKMRPRIPKDVYQTPFQLAKEIVRWVRNNFIWSEDTIRFLDPGAGSGVWGRAVYSQFSEDNYEMTGIDIRRLKPRMAYDFWYPNADFTGSGIVSTTPKAFDVVIGNPPFLVAEPFIRNGIGVMAPNGVLVYLLPSDFLYTQVRGRGLFAEHPPTDIIHLMQRPNFTGPRGESLGKSNSDNYFVGIWRKEQHHSGTPRVHWLDWKQDGNH